MEVTDCLFQQNYGGKDWPYIDNDLPRLLQATVNAIAGKAGSSRHQVPVTQPYDSQPKRSLFATLFCLISGNSHIEVDNQAIIHSSFWQETIVPTLGGLIRAKFVVSLAQANQRALAHDPRGDAASTAWNDGNGTASQLTATYFVPGWYWLSRRQALASSFSHRIGASTGVLTVIS
jgi:hypothetical protein